MCNRCNGKLASSDILSNIPVRMKIKTKCKRNNKRRRVQEGRRKGTSLQIDFEGHDWKYWITK